MTYFFNSVDKKILHGRKNGQSLKELVDLFLQYEPLSSVYISTIHILRVCFEDEVPFSREEIIAFCKKYWIFEDGGSIEGKHKYTFFTPFMFQSDCLAYSGRHKLKFVRVSSPEKSLEVHDDKQSKGSPRISDNFQIIQSPIETKSQESFI